MTEPTEAEIEAAAAALCDAEHLHGFCQRDFGKCTMMPCNCRELARVALTAAAQVRERAELDAVKDMQTRPESIRREHGLMPIYSTTEDQGEDVLGYRPPDGE